jgi:hypothetical protein
MISYLARTGRVTQEAQVQAFGEQFLAGGSIGATEPLLVETILKRLPKDRVLTVEVRDGDGGPAPDGAASHVIMIRADGLAALGLRCRYDSDPSKMAIVGVFEPGS